MPLQNQATSNPYSANVLAPHDVGLLGALEFGTNLATDVGVFFDWDSGVIGGYQASIDARLAMLSIRASLDGDVAPRGQSFPLLPPSEWPLIVGGPFAGQPGAVLYVHQYLRQHFTTFPATPAAAVENRAGVMIGYPSNLSGIVLAVSQNTFAASIIAPQPIVGPPPVIVPTILFDAWSYIAGVPTGQSQGPNGAAERFWRFAMVAEPTETEIEVFAAGSRDGLGWQECAQGECQVPDLLALSLGAYVRAGGNTCLLDWARLYRLPENFDPANPVYPDTGGRLFIG